MGTVMFVNGTDLFVDTVGAATDPAILLIGGAGSSLDWWEDGFCEGLAAGGRFVIRYDHRDTGQSIAYPAGAPGYTGTDLAADAVGVLDALGVRRAHLVGLSMGGGIAQSIAVRHPDRVESLVLMSTSPLSAGDPLPPVTAELLEHFQAPPPPPDWSDRDAVVAHLVEDQRHYAAPKYFDEARTRRLAERVVDRTRDVAASLSNHGLMEQGDPVEGPVRARTLVVHGTADPLFPFGHAEALVRAIPGADLLPLPDAGHQYPPEPLWPAVIPAILRHTSAG